MATILIHLMVMPCNVITIGVLYYCVVSLNRQRLVGQHSSTPDTPSTVVSIGKTSSKESKVPYYLMVDNIMRLSVY